MASRIRRLACAVAIAATAQVMASPATPTSAAASCAGPARAEQLTAAFAGGVDGLRGADYQRALALPDGRTLWTVQDAYLSRAGLPDRLVHNVGIVQDGACFAVLRTGSDVEPGPWIGADATEPFQRWFWPLAGIVAGDGFIRVFVAELREHGTRYLAHAEPVATWVATIDPVTLLVQRLEPAPDPGPSLYGWSVTSDAAFTYLYAHCYRQFGYGFLGHDTCTAQVTVARLPRRDMDAPLSYWDGTTWSPDPSAAIDIAPKHAPDGTPRVINPMQILHVQGRWIAATKEGDWWGQRIYLDRAPGPTGPWTTTRILTPRPLGPPADYNTYFASLLPTPDGRAILGISNNRFDGGRTEVYRPTFRDVRLSWWDWPHGPGRPRSGQP